MLAAADWQEPDKGNLHACQRAKGVPSAVAHIQSWAESAHADENEDVQRNQVSDEDITSPSRDHVAIE